jgi:hypothetical protein
MVEEIITIFCICDDLLKEIGYLDDKQARISTSEVLTIALVATKFFGGNYQKSRMFLEGHYYIKNMLSKSRFIRRLNSIDPEVLNLLFCIMAKGFKESNTDKEYAIDSFPIVACANVRIKRCKIYKGKSYNGFNASKQEFFYGIRVHMIVTKKSEPVEFLIQPGARSDIKVAKSFKFDLAKGSKIYADKGYTHYAFEDYLEFQRNIYLIPQRKNNSKRSRKKFCGKIRKKIETVFSTIIRDFPNRIHAATSKGFELKVILFIFAYAMKFLG